MPIDMEMAIFAQKTETSIKKHKSDSKLKEIWKKKTKNINLVSSIALENRNDAIFISWSSGFCSNVGYKVSVLEKGKTIREFRSFKRL